MKKVCTFTPEINKSSKSPTNGKANPERIKYLSYSKQVNEYEMDMY
jgi:hypothetical protein